MSRTEPESIADIPKTSRMETRSIDYVPSTERHGKVGHLLPVWFQGNANLPSLAVGLLGILFGGNFAWSAVAIVLGSLIGTLFMAFHSAQGPKLGLPQMIQSRPQFGYFGSLLPVIIAVLLFIGFNTFNTIIGGQAVKVVIHTNFYIATVLLVLLAVILTVIGYDLIHKALRWATYLFIVAYGVFTITALTHVHLSSAQLSLSKSAFLLTPFLIQLGATASYQLTWAPYVSEYSRYLPESTKTSSTFWWTYIGSSLGAIWMMVLGAYILAPDPSLGEIDIVKATADKLFNGFGVILLLLSVPGLVAVIAMNMYSGGLSVLSAVDVIKKVRPTFAARAVSIGVVTVVGTALAFILPESFLPSFNNFLLLVLYFMIPWTAVNLVDFFLIRHEKYAILDIYKKDGIYGRWGWRGITAYVVGFVAMIPFFSTTIYTGPIANKLGGGDISPVIGFPVAAILYFILCRSLDVAPEMKLADEQKAQLERDALASV
jgi:nucleobase:cation symporter-1, NCS1 family